VSTVAPSPRQIWRLLPGRPLPNHGATHAFIALRPAVISPRPAPSLSGQCAAACGALARLCPPCRPRCPVQAPDLLPACPPLLACCLCIGSSPSTAPSSSSPWRSPLSSPSSTPRRARRGGPRPAPVWSSSPSRSQSNSIFPTASLGSGISLVISASSCLIWSISKMTFLRRNGALHPMQLV
jgi:hypothetical protein